MNGKKDKNSAKLPGLIAIVLVVTYLLIHSVDGFRETITYLKPHIASVLSDLISSWGFPNG